MEKRTVLALCGPPAAGKTSVADELARCGATVIRSGELVSLAWQLKNVEIPNGLVVIDAAESIEDIARLTDAFRGQLVVAVLDASTTVCFERSRARRDQVDKMEKYLELLKRPHILGEIALVRCQLEVPGTIIVETEGLTIEAVANQILARLPAL